MRLIGSRVSGGRTVAATLAFDVQQPTVGIFNTTKIKGRGKTSRHHKEERIERAKFHSKYDDVTALRQLSGRDGVWALWVRCLFDSRVLTSLLASGSVSLHTVDGLWEERGSDVIHGGSYSSL